MKEQSLIIIDGLNGAGKTTVSKLLHRRLKKTASLSFDKIKWFISDYSRTPKEILLTRHILELLVKSYLAAGMSVMVESFFPKKEFIERFLKFAKNKPIKVYVYQIEAPHEIRFARIQKRPLAEGAKKPMDKKWLQRNDSKYTTNKYQKAVVFDSSKLTPEQIARKILKDL